jgi:hypothetical protein
VHRDFVSDVVSVFQASPFHAGDNPFVHISAEDIYANALVDRHDIHQPPVEPASFPDLVIDLWRIYWRADRG